MTYSIKKLQRRLGLDTRLHPLFEGRYSDQLNLLMLTPSLLDKAEDWPDQTHISGFTWFDPNHMRSRKKLADLETFLNNGEPPVIFTLGGPRRSSPGKFFGDSILACERLGIRSIIVAAQTLHQAIPKSASTLVTTYLPFSDLFSRAAAVVHSGGIGTIGWSLRHALPSLLVPTGVDQHDNAWRTCRKGFSHQMEHRDYQPRQVAKALKNLLEDQHCKIRLRECAEQLKQENGAVNAVQLIEQRFGL